MIFFRWLFWAMAIYFVLAGQMLAAAIFMILGVFPLITVVTICILFVIGLSGCTTYNTYDSFNTTEIRINDVKVQRSAVNPNNPYRREIK